MQKFIDKNAAMRCRAAFAESASTMAYVRISRFGGPKTAAIG